MKRLSNKFLSDVVTDALSSAGKTVKTLGRHGFELVQKNRFGDTALRADIEAEKAVLSVLRDRKVSIHVISEEHGTVDIGRHPQFLGILDGLDGSTWYRRSKGRGRTGTMFAIFGNLNPLYRDYVASGILMHPRGDSLLAVQDGGVQLRTRRGNTDWNIRTTDRTAVFDVCVPPSIAVDTGWNSNIETFIQQLPADLVFHTSHSSAIHYADVAMGRSDLALECTRKGNLEIAVAYGIIREAGGTIMTLDGMDIGQLRYRTFGQDCHVPVVAAATPTLAHRLIALIKS